MSESNSETTTPSAAPESGSSEASAPGEKPKRTTEIIHAHAVSWQWLAVGLACVFMFAGTFGLAYYIQTRHMATKMLAVAGEKVRKAEAFKAEREATDDPERRRELALESLRERNEAADLLNNFRNANPGAPGEAVLGALYDILETLYEDYGGSSTMMGRQRGEQLMRLATELVPLAPGNASLPYRTRLLQLEWDQVNLMGVISRGKELYEAAYRGGDPNNYDSQRYIALTLFDHLPAGPYDPAAHSLPPVFPEEMDELLRNLNSMHPEDIEVAKRYAEFMVSVDHPDSERRRIVRACASEQLLGKTPEARLADARRVIDEMVRLNDTNPAAYLARYHFHTHFVPRESALSSGDPDLATVLAIAPSHAEGLILSSRDALRLAEIAARNDEPERAAEWHHRAEEFLRRTVRDNPADPVGYRFLGDYLLSVKREPGSAIEVWNAGLRNAEHFGNEELIGRLALVLLDQRRVSEVHEKLGILNRSIAEMMSTRPGDRGRARDMRDLLAGQLANTEAAIAASRMDAARRANNINEVRRLASIEQAKKGEAIQKFEEVLHNWGTRREDYLFLRERQSVYHVLLPEALLQLGDLKMETGEWDKAATYFERALPIESPAVQRMALLKLSAAYQQGRQLDRAAAALKALSDRQPEDLSLRYAYTTLLFRAQVTANNPNPAVLDTIEQELDLLGEQREKLTQPWALDIRRIHLGVLRANLTNETDTILEAMRDATRRFRTLERETFPPDAEGNTRGYIEDPAFVAEMIGIYSSLAERSEFERLLDVLRTFPGGEDAYYEARINDALRRNAREEAVVIIDEAATSPLLSDARKERFVALLQTLTGDTSDSVSVLDRLYSQLKTSFDEAPETLRPQAFFALANMSLDRLEMEQARKIMERLRQIEGSNGTNWRYIQVRLMLGEQDPNFAEMRRIQETVAGLRPNWDMSYLLRALIEEKFLELNPGNPEAVAKLIESYQLATANGNTRMEVWQRLVDILDANGRTEEARITFRQAALRGVVLDSRTGQFPQPYARMYSQVQEELANENPTEADRIARSSLQLAHVRAERPELVFALNMTFGRVFLDAGLFSSAIRHLSETAKSGGIFVYPLALAIARAGDADAGFTLLLDEIDLVPSAMPTLLPTILVLIKQVQPSEEVYQRIDRLMERIERGERLTLSGTLEANDERDHFITIGTNRVPSRRIQSFVVRFPEKTENLDPSALWFVSPEELELMVEEEE